jgi:lipoprotein NlpD
MIFRHCCLLSTAILLIITLSTTLTSCARNGKSWNPEDYTVKSGDTLYSVAWRYELDVENLAAWNGMHASDLVKAGQRLHTRKPPSYETTGYKTRAEKEMTEQSMKIANQPSVEARPLESPTQQKWLKTEKGDTLYGISQQTGVSVQELAQLNQLEQPYIIQPGQTIFLKPLESGSNTSTAVSQNKKTDPGKINTQAGSSVPATIWPESVRWQRPAKGAVIKKFDRRRNDSKGIEIAGKPGDAIVASADGKVVYSGNGLISYGNLIIIKHNKTYLSAYAYNRKLLVKEGDQVKVGNKIAEMGHKDKQSSRLHFEIRKDGKPVDPLKYLPM